MKPLAGICNWSIYDRSIKEIFLTATKNLHAI
jgi:hypothetical protein